MITRFTDWVVVVTGGGRGIGLATARAFAEEGARVVVADIDAQLADEAAKAIGGIPVCCDVTSRDSIAEMATILRERFGRLDTLVANAGRPWNSDTLRATEEDWNACLDLNLKSTWLCAQALHPLLLQSKQASIVVVASAQGMRSNRSSFPYSAAKGGLLALTRSMAVEYAPDIRVNAIIPRQIESVRTEPYFHSFTDPVEARRRVLSSFPMRRLGEPEDIARAIAFLASTDAEWITGTFLTVDGGRDAALVDLSDLKETQE